MGTIGDRYRRFMSCENQNAIHGLHVGLLQAAWRHCDAVLSQMLPSFVIQYWSWLIFLRLDGNHSYRIFYLDQTSGYILVFVCEPLMDCWNRLLIVMWDFCHLRWLSFSDWHLYKDPCKAKRVLDTKVFSWANSLISIRKNFGCHIGYL